MSWFARILQRGKKAGDERTVPGPTPPEQWTVAGLPFDTTGWQLGAATPSRMAWTAPAATMVLTRSEARGEALAATLTELRNGERQEARARGEDIVAVDVLTTRGIEAFRAAYKRRSGSGHAYRGVVEVRGANACFRIESDIDEAGTTGTREAMVNAMRLKVGDMTFGPVSESGSRRILGHSHDPYDAAFDEDALLTVSDDERLDVLTPGHPIARTRSVFKAVIASLRISFDVVPGRILAAPAGREEQSRRGDCSRMRTSVVCIRLWNATISSRPRCKRRSRSSATHRAFSANCLMQLGVFFHMRDRPGNALPLQSRAEKLLAELSGADASETARGRTTASR